MVRFLVLQTLPKPAVFSPNNALLTLARKLDRSRFAMTVAVPRSGLLSEALEKEGIRVVTIAGLSSYRRHDAMWRLPVVGLKLARLVSRLGARLLVSNHAELGPFADLASRLCRIPWICFLRQSDRPPAYYEKYRVARAGAVAAVSAAALKAYHAYLVSRGKTANLTRVIPTGIDLPSEEDSAIHGSPGSPREPGGHAPTVGTVGLRSVKRPDLFLEIFSRVRRRLPLARAMMIGAAEPTELRQLQAMATSLGVADAVEFPGQQQDMGNWYPRMDAYAHSSRSEALPKVVLEAMAHSRPVVAFDVGGIGEAVSNGETGYLCAEGDLESFSSAVTRLLSDPALARQLGTAGRIRVEQCFSSQAMTQGMMALLDEVLQAPASGLSAAVSSR